MTSLLSIAAESVKNYSDYWLLTASLPPLFYFIGKKQKLNWLQRLLIKRAARRIQKGKSISKEDKSLSWLLVGVGLIGMAVGLLVKSGGLTIGGFVVAIMGIGFLLAGKRLH